MAKVDRQYFVSKIFDINDLKLSTIANPLNSLWLFLYKIPKYLQNSEKLVDKLNDRHRKCREIERKNKKYL